MSVLRFPNAVSDIGKFISTFKTIYNSLSDVTNFTHDDARDALIQHGLVSSSGAIGKEAIKRSIRDDRALDPLYNQLKMYSELYRMLGWYRPGTMNTNFNFTELSSYVANSPKAMQDRIFEECFLAIVFPNPLVNNKGGNILRPFPLILLITEALKGVIFRDEIIIAVLALENDRIKNIVETQADFIRGLRGDSKKLFQTLEELAANEKVQENTLQNYTRFPLGGLEYTKWCTSGSIKDVYEKSITGYRLEDVGKEKATQVKKMIDVRSEDISKFSLDERSAFTLLTHYTFLEKCGFNTNGLEEMISDLQKKSKDIFTAIHAETRQQILYSPVQQSRQEELDKASELDKFYNE